MGIQLSSCEVAFLLSDWLRDFGCRFGQGADCVLFQVLRCFSWSRFGVFPGFGGPARGSPTFLGLVSFIPFSFLLAFWHYLHTSCVL